MFKTLALIGVIATAAVALFATPASASSYRASDAIRGIQCVRDGVNFLRSNDLLFAAARQQVDYAPLDNTGGTGQIRTDLGDEAFLPLGQVIRLHFQNPGLFAWCDR